jgi:hypothetical protein
MSKAIHELVLKDLKNRQPWEERQRVWYEMRHNGLPRKSKPFPGAADLHYPLTDGQVDKLKPFYFSQVWGSELLAAFRSKRQQAKEHTQAVAAWYHYQMVEHTNFFDESLSDIDNMLTAGNAVLWFWWDEYEKALVFDAMDPVFCVMPKGVTDLQKAPRVTRILQIDPTSYADRDDYEQAEEFVKRITGKGAPDQPTKVDEKYSREGLTQGESDDQIVLHEVWVRTKEGWTVHTYSPLAPEEPVKAPYVCPYRMDGRPFLPAVDTPMEIKDKGYYASRGVIERGAPFESYMTRTWNEKADAMTFLNRPLFTHEGQHINLNNVRLIPGQVVGNNLRAVAMPAPPLSFAEEMATTREAAENLVQAPDYGLTKRNLGTKDPTATQIQAVGQVTGMSTEMRATIYRSRLTRLYRMTFAILRQYKKNDLAYFVGEELNQAPAEALHEAYLIQPDGSPDSWNKPARMQRAVARYQMLRGNPYVDQAELVKTYIEDDDARLVRRLYVDPQTTAADQQEDQAMELAILEMGYPARVKPADDDATHLQIVLGRVEMLLQIGTPPSAVAWLRMNEHLEAHGQQLATKNARAAKQIAPMVQRLRLTMAHIHPPVEQFPAAQPAAVPATAGGAQ